MALKTSAITVGDTATELTHEQPRGKADDPTQFAVFNNDSSVTLFIGGSDVSTTNGYPVLAQTGVSWPLMGKEQVYGIVASGTLNARVAMSRV